ncbi:MAG: hypothetical protein WCH98_09435 [Verrucomicrobiota bacterium]
MNSNNPHDNPLYTAPLEMGGLEIRPLDLLEHVLATGGTGSGKTRSFLLPLVERVLARFGTEETQKAGMILIDAKGDMTELASECVRRGGRQEDLYILGEGGNCWFSLFDQFDGDPTAVADFLFEMLEDRSGTGAFSQNESFWEENARRLLRAGVICAKAQHGSELGGLQGIADGVNLVMGARKGAGDDDDEGDEPTAGTKEIEALANSGFLAERINFQESNHLVDYIKNDVVHGNPRTWGVIANMTRNYIAQFSQPDLQELFQESGGKRKLIPEDVIDEGLLLIVSLSPVVYRAAANPFRLAVKKAFCERILQRNHLVICEGGRQRDINQTRPILYVMDEFHTTLSPKGRGSDAYFLDRAREFRCMCVLATQGISAICSVLPTQGMRDHLLNNCRTKFFFANDCPQTSKYFQEIGGDEDRKVISAHFQRVPPPPRFRLPNHEFVEPPTHVLTSHAVDTRKQSRFSSAELGGLPNGTALVVTKGRKLVRYQMDPQSYACTRKEVAL